MMLRADAPGYDDVLGPELMLDLKSGVPNLDEMTNAAELALLAKELARQPRAYGRILFPKKPLSYIHTTKQLARCAMERAQELECTAAGNFYGASLHAAAREEMYWLLPLYARWRTPIRAFAYQHKGKEL